MPRNKILLLPAMQKKYAKWKLKIRCNRKNYRITAQPLAVGVAKFYWKALVIRCKLARSSQAALLSHSSSFVMDLKNFRQIFGAYLRALCAHAYPIQQMYSLYIIDKILALVASIGLHEWQLRNAGNHRSTFKERFLFVSAKLRNSCAAIQSRICKISTDN